MNWATLDCSSAIAAEPEALVRSIAPQPLAPALMEYARQTGLQLVYVSAVLFENSSTHGVSAPLGRREALEKLLAGTGLEYEFINNHTVRLYTPHPTAPPPPPPPPIVNDPDPAPLRTVVVNGRRVVAGPPSFAPASAKELSRLDTAVHDIESAIERSHAVYARPELDHYLQGVAVRLLAHDRADIAERVHVRVFKDAEPTAFALSNGSIYLTTDLLMRLESEAEVACVLGHEMAHFLNQHPLRQMRQDRRDKAVVTGALAVLDAALSLGLVRRGVQPTPYYPMSQLPPGARDIWARASVVGYSGDLELEADIEGLRRMAAGGYDASVGIAAFERLASTGATDGTEARADFSAPSRLQRRLPIDRALVAAELADAVGPPNVVDRESYSAAIRAVNLDQVEILLDFGKLERAEGLVDSEIAAADSARAEFLKGEIERRIDPQTDESMARAISAYARSTVLPDAPPAAFRQLGILARRRGDKTAAAAAFTAYLERAPQAVDVALVRFYLESVTPPASSRNDP